MVVINGTIDIDSKCGYYCNLDKGLQLEKRHPNASIASPLVPLQLELSHPTASVVSVSLPVMMPLNHTERRGVRQLENTSVASRVQPLSPPVLPSDSSHCIIDMLDELLTAASIHVDDSLFESGTRARNQVFLPEESSLNNQSLRSAFDLRPDLLGDDHLLEEDHGDNVLGKLFRFTRGRIDRMLRKLKMAPMEKQHIETLIKKASISMAATSGVNIRG
jgi:hypothetical protein